MSVVYYKSRREAGEKAVEAFAHMRHLPASVVSLNTDSLVIGAMLSNSLACPLQLYVTADINIPGNLNIGSVNQAGGFSNSSELSSGESDYFYQEFRGYIEDTKRSAFSGLNRELQGETLIRKDLLKNRHIIIVDDCMTDRVTLDSFIEYLKSVSYHNLYVCTPIISTKLISHVRQISEFSYFAGTVDFFYGKDHYFEDNSVYDRTSGIKLVSEFLKLWPTPA